MSVPTVFENLGAALAQCTCLQHLLVGFVHRDFLGNDPAYRPENFVHLLANLPPTLRTVVFRVRVLRWRSWLAFLEGAMLGFTAADILLAPSPSPGGGGPRFPELERVELRVVEHSVAERDVAPSGRASYLRPPSRYHWPEKDDPRCCRGSMLRGCCGSSTRWRTFGSDG
ncbi:hypothetical protein GSI_11458 [Ganoderma sinense ZZ0214-1]|uniref:Uncharacterized protein n=1 Tax=Ganoderma sinense ZZ0214-1 TaxID=1077348 RepID=A0A2G8RWL6_9APHY|nr:hypothetical protein GSI_11458 [Ganoderma sinense ZZ0214-1]